MVQVDKFQIHYYLANSSHAMDAFVRNKCESELLAIFQETCLILGTNIKIESIPFDEGGLKEFWKCLSDNSNQITVTLGVLTFMLTCYSTFRGSDPQKDEREKIIQELTIEEKKKEIELKNFALEKIKKEMNEKQPSQESIESAAKVIAPNHRIKQRISNFYKLLNHYEKVTQVGFSAQDIFDNDVIEERVVPRKNFGAYILSDNSLPTEKIDGAMIEIISPVLKEGNYKWKGIYNKESISFSMADGEFKSNVFHEKITFQHGSFIKCILQIHRKLDEAGEIVVTGYSVQTVIEKTDGGITSETAQGKRHRENKKYAENQKVLF